MSVTAICPIVCVLQYLIAFVQLVNQARKKMDNKHFVFLASVYCSETKGVRMERLKETERHT